MTVSQPVPTSDDIRAVYSAIVDYHNNLVQTRFTVAGLVLAANGFLAGAYFQSVIPYCAKFSILVLGILMAFICWLLELRTHQLLANLGTRGLELEKSLGLSNEQGFFSLMEHQPISAQLLLTGVRLPSNNFTRKFFTHSFGIGLLYPITGLFWLVLGFFL
jgi:hypothetical protein